MKKFSYLGFIISFILLSACQENKQGQPQGGQAMPYPVVEVPLKTITGFNSYPVSIEGTVNSAVRAKVAGYIREVLVDEGAPVRKGQTLFLLETESLTGDAGAARANVNAAQVEVDKLKPLVEKGIISEVQLQTAEARLAQAKASYNSIAASIGYATIKSPVDGYVGAIPYRQGSLVSPGDPTPLTTVSDIDNVYAYFALNERDYLDFIQTAEGNTLAEKIRNFPPVSLELINGQIYKEKGKIETVTGQINPSTGTVSFRAIFPNPNRILTNGNSGNIRIPQTYENVALVPEASSFERQGRVYVFEVKGDSIAVSRSIEVKDRIENVIVVESGIEAGAKIVAQGVGKLRDNTPVVPQPVAFDSIANSLKVVFK